jgi:hypothetical protein
VNASQNIPQDLLPAGPRETGLQVEFEWIKDRFVHRVLALVAGEWTPLLESSEGDDHNLWPPSPALQQLSIEPMPNDRRAALAVGMSGKSHYSISIDADQVSPRLSYDVACRYTEQPEFIGSSFRLHGKTQQVDDQTVAIAISDDRQLRIQIIPSEVAQQTMTLANGELQINAAAETAPATVRWRFAIEFV